MRPALSLIFLVGVACPARADFDPRHWQTRMPIAVRQPGMTSVLLDPAVYKASRATLRDLRIVHGGTEVPYRVRILDAQRKQLELQPRLLDKTAIPNTGVQATLDLNGHPAHNRLRIATTQRNFKETVRIETSDDGRAWAVAREDGLIFDISRTDRQISELSLDYPVSTRRYVRLTIPGWHDPAYLTSAWLTYFEEGGAVRDIVSTSTPAIAEDPKAKATLLTTDIGFLGLPYDRVELMAAGDDGVFSRSVDVETSADGKMWGFAGHGWISRLPREEHLSIDFPGQWNRYVRLTVFHGDSAPLKVTQVRLSDLRRLLDFSAGEAGNYWLYAGNPGARQPSYDVSGLAATADTSGAPPGEAEANPQYRAPEQPFTERYPRLLNLFLVVVVAVMGYMTIRLLRRVKTG